MFTFSIWELVAATLIVLLFSRLLWLFAGSWPNSILKAFVLDMAMGLVAAWMAAESTPMSTKGGMPDYAFSFSVYMTAAAIVFGFDAIRVRRGARAKPISWNKPVGRYGTTLGQDIRWIVITVPLALAVSYAFVTLSAERRVVEIQTLKKSLPQRVDDVTMLFDVDFDGRTTTYLYVIDTKTQTFDVNTAKKKFRELRCSRWTGRYSPYFVYAERYEDQSGRHLASFSPFKDC